MQLHTPKASSSQRTQSPADKLLLQAATRARLEDGSGLSVLVWVQGYKSKRDWHMFLAQERSTSPRG